MSSAAATKIKITDTLDAQVLSRIVQEGYGPGAWHGNDLRAALADINEKDAFWRPAPGCHNIAEIALHHAYCVRSVRARVTGEEPEPFVLKGEDWFELDSKGPLKWKGVLQTLENEHKKLAEAFASLGKGKSAQPGAEQFDLALGITCHAIYHAGQVQLIKRLREK